jgi:hypothetical protein
MNPCHFCSLLTFAAGFLLISLISPASANDASYFASGNHIFPLQETDISVKKEVLTIKRIENNKVRITVDYTFHNPTAEKSLLMGFEAKSPSGDVDGNPRNGEHPYIENFSVSLNGKASPHKVSILSLPDQLENQKKITPYTIEDLKKQQTIPKVENSNQVNLIYVYHFPATFASGDTLVKHTYDYAISGAIFTRTSIDYLLTPALRWANKQIDDFTLIIDLGEFQEYHLSPSFFDNLDQWTTQGRVKIGMENVKNEMTEVTSQMMTVWQHHGSVRFHAKNFQPKGELELFANQFIYNDEILDANTMKFTIADSVWLGDVKLKDESTRNVLKNLPYARRGYVFKNPKLKAFFESQSWYLPDPNYRDSSISDEEKTWLKEISEIPTEPVK